MSTASTKPAGDRKTGKVTRVFRDYGFITCSDVQDKDVYFKTSSFPEHPPLRQDEIVEFDLTHYSTADGTNWEARNLSRPADQSAQPAIAQTKPRNRLPTSGYLFDWAYLGYLPNVLAELKGLALAGERWEFKNAPRNPERPLPILFSYLMHTFERLVLENKILVNEQASLAAFNTGLVDQRYEKIY